jgi:dipeptidyl aminopeptidase/acylaminoacyl peptidase
MSTIRRWLPCLVGWLALTVFLVPAFAQQAAKAGPSDTLQPMDVFHMQYDANPQISPDGTKIVYERHFGDIFADRWRSNLWIVNFDGSGDSPLTTGNYSDQSPRWSPDGTRIAYISDRDGHPQVYVRWMATGQTARITNLSEAPSNISWSPDGTRIAFTSFVTGAPTVLAHLPNAPAGAKWEPPPILSDKLVWRFNGRGLIPNGHTQIFVVGAGGTGLHQVSHGDYDFTGSFGGTVLHWTPDGKDIIFSANLRPDADYEMFNTEVYEISVATGKWKALTNRLGPDNAPAISPDGTKIAYTGFDDKYLGHQTTHLYIMNRDGSGSHVVTASFDRDIGQPHWAADGTGVYVTYDSRGDTKFAFVSTTGQRKLLAEHLGTRDTAYSSGGTFSIARDGRFAVAYTRIDLPGSIAVGNAGEPNQVKVVDNPNREFLAHKTLGRGQEFTFKSSYDQQEIQGWIITPPHFDPSHKYPLFLHIHGGPFANYGDRFDIEKQVWAAAGYVVVYVNPRGSTSYGQAFANLIHHAYPGHDFEDLNTGVSTVIAKGYINPNQLYVAGGSGGGVLTCWMVDHTKRFRAAMAMYPVINWYSWVLDADIPILGTKYWFPGPPWEYWQQYMQRSPINMVGNVETPTALMTGLKDYRTPISEAEQFYEALKLRKIDTMLIQVPGEPHGLERYPSHMVAKIMETLAWFQKHSGH